MSNYKILTDLHTHTIASTHAFSTLTEMAGGAKKNGIELIAMTDHGPALPDSPHIWHFECMYRLPDYIDGVRILKGIECNILNDKGDIDYDHRYMSNLKIIIASVHSPVYIPSRKEDFLSALEGAAMNEKVGILGHVVRCSFALKESDLHPLLSLCLKNKKLVEINSSCLENDLYLKNTKVLIKACKKMAVPVAVNSDAHISFEVGDFSVAISLLEEEEFPEELIVNSSVEKVFEFFSL